MYIFTRNQLRNQYFFAQFLHFLGLSMESDYFTPAVTELHGQPLDGSDHVRRAGKTGIISPESHLNRIEESIRYRAFSNEIPRGFFD